MFSSIRVLFVLLRMILNCLFFPTVSLAVCLLFKIAYDLASIFTNKIWGVITHCMLWMFGDNKFWEIDKLFHNNQHIETYLFYGFFVTFAISCLLNLGISNLIIKTLRRGTDIRSTAERETEYRNRIISASNSLENKYIAKYNKEPLLKVKIIDSGVKNAIIFSDNVIVVTTELLENTSDRELEGVLAHEWGHMHNGDTKFNQFNFSNTIISNNIESGAVIRVISWILTKLNVAPFIGAFMSLFFFVLFSPFFGCVIVFSLISSLLSLFEAQISQKQEYKADEFALGLNAGEGLLDFLYEDMKMQDNFWQLSSFVGMGRSALTTLYKTHPASHKRVKRLETLVHGDKYKQFEVTKPIEKSKWL